MPGFPLLIGLWLACLLIMNQDGPALHFVFVFVIVIVFLLLIELPVFGSDWFGLPFCLCLCLCLSSPDRSASVWIKDGPALSCCTPLLSPPVQWVPANF